MQINVSSVAVKAYNHQTLGKKVWAIVVYELAIHVSQHKTVILAKIT